MNMHYIKLEEGTDIVQRGFSDAFEEPKDSDICINMEGGRHFAIDGQPNPPMQHSDGCPRYIWSEYHGLTETNEAWRKNWLDSHMEPTPDPNLTPEERLDRLELIILQQNGVI